MNNAQSKQIWWLPALPDEGWASMDRYWRELTVCAEQAETASWSISTPAWLGSPPARSRAGGEIRRAWNKYVLYPARVRRAEGHLFHILDHSYAHLIPHIPKGARTVVTVFDLVPLEMPDGMSPAQVRRFAGTVAHLRQADHIISISEETKVKLERFLDIPPERVTVAVPGMDFALFHHPVPADNAVAVRLQSEPAVIFSVGSALARKNLGSLTAIFDPISSWFRERRCVFVRAGERLPDALREGIIAVTGEAGFIELGPLYGEDLAAAYQKARIFIFPSTLEGLTFTIPEAMAAGCAVVTNRCTANPEAGGEAALYYNEGDSRGAAQQIEKLLADDTFHAEASQRSVARARELSWARHFTTVSDVYGRILES